MRGTSPSWRRLITGIPLWASASVAAAECGPGAPPQQLDLGYRLETLDPDAPDWSDQELLYTRMIEPRRLWSARLTQSRRFGEADTTIAGGGVLPVTRSGTLSGELALSPTHRVLPRGTAQLSWNEALGQGWGLQAGARYLRYEDNDVTLGDLGVEKYAGNWRYAYSYGPSYSESGGKGESHRIQVAYFYGQRNSVQALAVRGDEVDKPTSADEVSRLDVSSYALFGLQGLGCHWALGWSIGRTDLRGDADGHRTAYGLFLRRYF